MRNTEEKKISPMRKRLAVVESHRLRGDPGLVDDVAKPASRGCVVVGEDENRIH